MMKGTVTEVREGRREIKCVKSGGLLVIDHIYY